MILLNKLKNGAALAAMCCVALPPRLRWQR
jgi:hypothetical protein